MEAQTNDIEHLANIIVCMDEFMGSWTQYKKEKVEKDLLLLFGFVKLLELIGQETAALSPEFKQEHPCEWDALEELKDVFRWNIKAEDLYDINWQTLPTIWTRVLDIFEEIKG